MGYEMDDERSRVMKRCSKVALSMLIALMCGLATYSAAFAESDAETQSEEEVQPAEQEEQVEAQEEDENSNLAELEGADLVFKPIRLEAVKGGGAIEEPHFKLVTMLQNTSPYVIQNPTVYLEVTDPGLNQLADAKLDYSNIKLVLQPGDSKLVEMEFESLVDVVPGQSVKNYKVHVTDSLYGERLEASRSFAKGAYVFVNSKQLKVKVGDPHGWMYVPSKDLLETMGFKYVWNAKTSSFTATKGTMKIEHKIGTQAMKVGGKIVKIGKNATALVNKVPMLSLELTSIISKNWMMNSGIHDDVKIITVMDLSSKP